MQNTELLNPVIPLLHKLFEKHGPDAEDYQQIFEFVDQIQPEEIEGFREAVSPILNPNTIIGFSYTKPFGYNGDFFIIEKIYQKYVNPAPQFKKWDEFFHTFPAAIAVINRKKLAVEIINKLNTKAGDIEKQVMILGSGPVNEVNEFFTANPDSKLKFDMLDLDKRAITYAKNKNKEFISSMTFFNQNVIRFQPDKTYDLIWSAGLFDYFKDKHFVYLLKKYYAYVKEGGEMIIGNFNVENPSRKIMEILGDWFLFHRSKDELVKFALQAGIPKEKIEVITEPLGINLFLVVRK